MQKRTLLPLSVLSLLVAGCSPKDAPPATPVFRAATPTYRSSVNSWEINREPFYTQPGVNGGKPVTLKPIPSQRGFEPYDPVAEAVYAALVGDGTVPTKYLAANAKDGVVILIGTVEEPAQKSKAGQIARGVAGVRQVRNELTVVRAPKENP